MSCPDGPVINREFPYDKALSPPMLDRPIFECAEAVRVSGFVPCAIVRVYANITELVGEDTPPFAVADITLNRALKLGDSITATQTVLRITSTPTIVPVMVSPNDASAVSKTKPKVHADLYECGALVPVDNVVAGTRIHVQEDGVEIGSAATAADTCHVWTSQLHASRNVTAFQVLCEGSDHETKGLTSDPVRVNAAPSPIPPPTVEGSQLISGTTVVWLNGLLCGARVEIFQSGAVITNGGWYANGTRNYFPVKPLTSSPVTAIQILCGEKSPESKPATPAGRLHAPKVVGPICKGSQFAVIRDTFVNSVVVVLRNGSPIGYAGGLGSGSDVIVAFGSGRKANSGETITALQYFGTLVSPRSTPPVTVVSSLSSPSVEIFGGEPFFWPKGSEVPIDGPVFPRGRGKGPVIRMQACCSEGASIQITGPRGEEVSTLTLTELFPGYWTATWPWDSAAGWKVPDEIPVGKYTILASSKCTETKAQASFYVIFNPEDVNGPPRFGFDDTNIWFGTGINTAMGLYYHLHQSDKRIFSIAISAVNGMINSFDAAVALSRVEEGLFVYSEDYNSQDVLDMVLHHQGSGAQCADDASVLTSFMRAVGIPAHSVTADAAVEIGAGNWAFDTWVEFLSPTPEGTVDWRILHPHSFPGMAPEDRPTFGNSRFVATKSFNDIIIMANNSWVEADAEDSNLDVSYGRQACGEPDQIINKAFWIDELCEQGYWSSPHWDCSASLRAHTGGGSIELGRDALAFGKRVRGVVKAGKADDDRGVDFIELYVVGNAIESKAFPNSTFSSIRLARDAKSGQFPFTIKLPATCAAGRQILLWAKDGESTVAMLQLEVPPRLKCSVDSPEPSGLTVGKTVTFEAVLANTSSVPVTGVEVSIVVPWALVVENAQRTVGKLDPGRMTMVTWSVKPIASLTAGSVQVNVDTADGGGIKSSRVVRVRDLKAEALTAKPGTPLSESGSMKTKKTGCRCEHDGEKGGE
ncbi:chloride channel [Ilyonectria robusta]